MKTDSTIIEATPKHFDEILVLNEAAVPNVNSLSLHDLKRLVSQSRLFLAAVDGKEKITGFILTLDESAEYSSPNFQYFKRNYAKFLYVDRIVVASRNHRTGVGSQFYQEVETRLGSLYPLLTCEVNIEPPNEQSMRFHHRLGFVGVEEQETENGTKRVLLMSKRLGVDE